MGISNINSSSISSALTTDTNSNQSQLLATLLSSTSNQKTLFDVLAEGSGGTSAAYDILDLSSAGQSAADSLTKLLEEASVASVQTSVNTLSSSMQKKISVALKEAGIDTSQKIQLQVDSSGNVVVSNDNAQAEEIEAAINNAPDLKKAVVEYVDFMKSMAPTLTSSSNSESTASSTVQQLLSLLGGSTESTVTLNLSGDSMKTTYRDSSSNLSVLASC
jgi:hypothetical protein